MENAGLVVAPLVHRQLQEYPCDGHGDPIGAQWARWQGMEGWGFNLRLEQQQLPGSLWGSPRWPVEVQR